MADLNTYNECIEIINDKKKLNHKELETKWDNFNKKLPALYKMLISNEHLDLNLLKFMCDKAQEQNKLSKEEQLEIDFEVGDKLAKKFIYEKFPEPSDEQKDYIKKSLREKINKGESLTQKDFLK